MHHCIRVAVLLCVLALTDSPVFAVRPTIEYLDIPEGFSFTLTGVAHSPSSSNFYPTKKRLPLSTIRRARLHSRFSRASTSGSSRMSPPGRLCD